MVKLILQDRNDWHVVMQSVASLYCKGNDLNWSSFENDGISRKIALPTYPFERKYCWFKNQKTNEKHYNRADGR